MAEKNTEKKAGMRPETEAELAEMVRGAGGPLYLRGGGTRGPVAPGAAVDLTGLSGVRLYEPGALTLVAGAGTPLAEVEALLAGEGQRLPFEPPDLCALLGRSGRSTIGGVAAANASGPARVRAGAARDAMIGLRAVDGRGAVIKSGGRVMKNVTGLDLVKLMAGAHGTLGVLSEVAFKLLPAAETTASLCLHGLTVERAVAAMAAALGSPFEVSGAAHVPGQGETHLRLEGFAASVAYRLERLRGLMAAEAAEMSVSPEPGALWRGLRDGAPLAGRAGDLWRLSVQPSAAPALVRRLPEGARSLLDWGGGLIWALVPDGTDLRAHLGGFAGHGRLMRGGAGMPVFQPQAPGPARLAEGLRAAFDPRGILNRGIMG